MTEVATEPKKLKLASGEIAIALKERFGIPATYRQIFVRRSNGEITLRRAEGGRDWYCYEEDLPAIAEAFLPAWARNRLMAA